MGIISNHNLCDLLKTVTNRDWRKSSSTDECANQEVRLHEFEEFVTGIFLQSITKLEKIYV